MQMIKPQSSTIRVCLVLVCILTLANSLQCTAILNNETGLYEGGFLYAVNTTQDGQSCICRSNMKWLSDQQKCVVDCANIPYSTGTAFDDYECQCVNGTLWVVYHFRCYVDCRSIPNAVFSPRYRICVPNCDVIQYAYGAAFVTYTGLRCHCQTGFKWDFVNSYCVDTATYISY